MTQFVNGPLESSSPRGNVLLLIGSVIGLASAMGLAWDGRASGDVLSGVLTARDPSDIVIPGQRLVRIGWCPLGVALGGTLVWFGLRRAARQSGLSLACIAGVALYGLLGLLGAILVCHATGNLRASFFAAARSATEVKPEQLALATTEAVVPLCRGWLLLAVAQVALLAGTISQIVSRPKSASSAPWSSTAIVALILLWLFGVIVSTGWIRNGLALQQSAAGPEVKAALVAAQIYGVLWSGWVGSWLWMGHALLTIFLAGKAASQRSSSRSLSESTLLKTGLVCLAAWGVLPILGTTAAAAEVTKLQLDQPQPHQVIQRTGVAPGAGYAEFLVRGDLPKGVENATWEYRVVPTGEESGRAGNWAPLVVEVHGTKFSAKARGTAGGWYRLDVRCRVKGDAVAVGSVEPFGIGELFVVAGQSYATNTNEERLTIKDPRGRVVALNAADETWRIANDPQPAPDGSDGGSIWPPLGDALANELRVPIGFANVAVGGTSSMQWMPEGQLHPRLIKAGQTLGSFRAVLWQQGESDVIAKTPLDQYVANVQSIRDTAAKAWGVDPPWLLAKSTHHPTVYNNPEGEGRIRSAIDELLKRPGFRPGPDTDTLQGENRGDVKSRRHFSAIGQQRAAQMWLAAIRREVLPAANAQSPLRVGVAAVDITPPVGFPMAGYYHERLAEGAIDPLQAKAIVFRSGETAAALVVCDLIGIATDLKLAIRQRATEKTGISASHIIFSATHSHTAPDYMKELYLKLGGTAQEPLRAAYIEKLIGGPAEAIAMASAAARPAVLEAGAAIQDVPVSFNRRFVMRDGSVRTWMNYENPEVVRAAGPIDPEIGLVTIREENGEPRGILSNFALHLDTVGGMKWSADYPYFIEQTIRQAVGPSVISIFGTGCCGDINHVTPRGRDRNKSDFIGHSIGESIVKQLGKLTPLERTDLAVKSRVVRLPLQDATKDEVARSIQVLDAARRKEKVDFLEHVTAYKKLILDELRHPAPFADTTEHITWGLSRSLAGIGETLPVEVTVITLGRDVAIVTLPGEVFVELGLAIKQGSPFRTTLVIELSNCVETIYIPNRAAYAGGSYEVTNSATQPGSGEMLVETALSLLREAATEATTGGAAKK